MIESEIKTKNFATIYPSKLNSGEIHISGYKHASNLIIAAAILLPEITITLNNLPDVKDTKILLEILASLGANITYLDNTCRINTANLCNQQISVEFTQQVHGTIYLIPALLCRFGEVELGKCGGCPIGETDLHGNSRPITHIMKILEQFGASFTLENDYIKGKLNKIVIPSILDIQDFSDDAAELTGQYVSGATKTAILAALAMSNEEIAIKNPYIKADVRELLNFLVDVGIQVDQTDDCLKIKNAHKNKNVNFFIMSDINEVFTYITFSIFNNLDLKLCNVTVTQVRQAFLQEEIVLKEMGIILNWGTNYITLQQIKTINSLDIDIGQAEKYSVYADHQPFFALLLTMGNNTAVIRDRVWKRRFQYVPELLKLGYLMTEKNGELYISPGKKPNINQIDYLIGHDVRAAAVVLMAAIQCNREIKITGLEHLNRGYVDFIGKLKSLGVNLLVENIEPIIAQYEYR
jgi:UDP-N-acetylglucosamine 1-carboxyvinyltransferase